MNKYYLWFLVEKYLLFWRKCPECAHPNWWHYWSDKVYCWDRNDGHTCSCGYHCGR